MAETNSSTPTTAQQTVATSAASVIAKSKANGSDAIAAANKKDPAYMAKVAAAKTKSQASAKPSKAKTAAKPVTKAKSAPKSAKKAKAPTASKVKKSGAGRAPTRYTEDSKIVVLAKENPKREGTGAYERFALYTKHNTVAKYLKAGGLAADLWWDSKPENKFIKFTD